ncbi:hypothetical protein [Arsenicibacter rosenii]|uniref:hypothetical protein n=1 Tax=Arsenicibacter rosenii TaxID=1750698 RepID=UPI0015A60709|nr:hypothetical protein [Arsenicibacter rosenii]
MSQETDRLIFEIEIREGAAKEKAKALRKEIEGLKQQKKDLDTLNKNGVLSAE